MRRLRALLRTQRRRAIAGGLVLALGGAVAAYAVLVLSTVNAPPPAGLGGSGRPSLPAVRLSPNPSSEIACAGSFAPSASYGPGPAGPWVVAGGGTGGYVGYRAAEILAFEFVRAPNDAVGRTTVVSGHLTIDGERLTRAEVTANVAELHSDIDIRDSHVSEFLGLRSRSAATFTLASPIELGSAQEGTVIDVSAPGQLALLDETREVTFPLEARWNGDSIEVAGQLSINRSDFGMDIPQLLGFRVSEQITIELSLLFVRPGQPGCAAPEASSPSAIASPSTSPAVSPPAVVTLDRLPEGWGEIAFLGLESEGGSGPPPAELYVLRGGDAAPRAITDSRSLLEDEPAWSFDGRRLAYTAYPENLPPSLMIVDADGSNGHQVGASILRAPAWAPDGRSLLAVPAEEQTGVYLVDVADGARQLLFQAEGVEDTPAWSPDGRTIAFTLLPKGGTNEDIYLADADGSNVRQLTSDAAYEYEPRWSPDSRTIAFVRGGDLWLIGADGSDQRRLTTGLTVDSPTWSPDGRHIAFVIAGGGSMNEGPQRRSLWFIDTDGGNLSNMAFDLFQVAHPAWRPT
jgi:polyisoprenoid-binding protein YceI